MKIFDIRDRLNSLVNQTTQVGIGFLVMLLFIKPSVKAIRNFQWALTHFELRIANCSVTVAAIGLGFTAGVSGKLLVQKGE
jgi:hypothetical protein